MSNAIHQSLTDQHFTPSWVLTLVRLLMGGIDLDPCSSHLVNDWSVRAKTIYTSDGIGELNSFYADTGLNVWCNPPSTYPGEAKDWLKIIINRWEGGGIAQCCFLLFNRENLGKIPSLKTIPRFHFANRLRYWSYNELIDQFQEGNWAGKPDANWSIFKNEGHWIARPSDNNRKSEVIKTKKAAIEWVGSDSYRIWTNSPTHPSTLLYFPPINDWNEACNRFEDVFGSMPGNTIIPRRK